jgi:hypothetical protein
MMTILILAGCQPVTLGVKTQLDIEMDFTAIALHARSREFAVEKWSPEIEIIDGDDVVITITNVEGSIGHVQFDGCDAQIEIEPYPGLDTWAHKIGHVLGLEHRVDQSNIMGENVGGYKLTSTQRSHALSSYFARRCLEDQ